MTDRMTALNKAIKKETTAWSCGSCLIVDVEAIQLEQVDTDTQVLHHPLE